MVNCKLYEVSNSPGRSSVFRRRVRTRVDCALLAVLLVPGLVWAQNGGSGNQETISQLVEQIKQLQQEDRDLQERIRILERRQLQTSPVPEPDPATAAIPPQSAEQTASPPVPVPIFDWHNLHGIQWRGFGEVNYKVLDQRRPELGDEGFVPGSAGNFYTGDLDLFLSAKLNDKASVLSEIALGEFDDQTFTVDLERFLLKYEFNDHLKMSFGRYQSGISYYNTAFRSAKWLLTTVDRPLTLQFADQGGLLPTQAVGVSINGTLPSGELGLNYFFEYGSSNTVRPDINGSGKIDDETNGNHVNVGFFVRPEVLPGLQIGGSFYHDKISDSLMPSPIRIGQTIVNAHVVYVAHGVEFLNEGFLIRHSFEPSGTVFHMPAFYSQISRRFAHIRPFFRYQYINANPHGIFEDVDLRYGPSFGARYDFTDNIAFKAQLDHTVRKDQPDLNGLQMQVVFTF
jgi:hypothetical protein